MTTFSERFKKLRKDNNLPIKQLRYIFNKSMGTINNYENGKSYPYFQDMVLLATKLNTLFYLELKKNKQK